VLVGTERESVARAGLPSVAAVREWLESLEADAGSAVSRLSGKTVLEDRLLRSASP
jgi:hypothetical protein